MTEPHLSEGLDPEGPSADDLHRFGDELTECASCGEQFYDQSDLCPSCGTPIRDEKSMPVWAFYTVVVVVLGIVIVWVL